MSDTYTYANGITEERIYEDVPEQVQDAIDAYRAAITAINQLCVDEDLKDEDGEYRPHPALQDALDTMIVGEASVIKIAKHVACRGREMPDMPTPVDIPIRDMALYEMWIEPSTKNSINPLLADEKRDLFEAKLAYDRAIISRRAVLDRVLEPIDLLVGMLNEEKRRLALPGDRSGSAPKSRASPTPKSRVGDSGAYHVINPATGKTHVARERDWVLKNCKDSISREGFNPDEYLLEVFTYDEAGNKIPA